MYLDKRTLGIFGGLIAALAIMVILVDSVSNRPSRVPGVPGSGGATGSTTPSLIAPGAPFAYTFNDAGILQEAGSMDESASPYWWLNSGGEMIINGGIGSTIQGDLHADTIWHKLYDSSSAEDTDGGLHPQNLFRLITRGKWKDMRQEAYFRINRDNLSASPNRNESNGLLLFNRYRDNDDLYYTGLRVDGTAVIKKKIKGIYYTLDEEPFFSFAQAYDRQSSPSSLPKNTWIGERTEVATLSGTVRIRLYVDVGRTGVWKLAAQAVDDGRTNGPVIDEAAYAGIRTDFMDVDISDYRVEEIAPGQ